MLIAKDVNGVELAIGDQCWYARKQNYSANGEMVKATITDILISTERYNEGKTIVRLGKFKATESHKQLLKI